MPFYKLTRSDGRDFWSGRIDYACAYRTGEVLWHPLHGKTALDHENDASYFSVATAPSATLGNFIYDPKTPNLVPPCRLFEVEPVGEESAIERLGGHEWRALQALRVTKEHPAELVLGPNHKAVVTFYSTLKALSVTDLKLLALTQRVVSGSEYAQLMSRLIRCSGMYCLAVYLGLVFRYYAKKATGTTKGTVYPALRDALITTSLGIATKGALPEHERVPLIRNWRTVFGEVDT